jgi:hypothetical protein
MLVIKQTTIEFHDVRMVQRGKHPHLVKSIGQFVLTESKTRNLPKQRITLLTANCSAVSLF